jgi:hypothetical protein
VIALKAVGGKGVFTLDRAPHRIRTQAG